MKLISVRAYPSLMLNRIRPDTHRLPTRRNIRERLRKKGIFRRRKIKERDRWNEMDHSKRTMDAQDIWKSQKRCDRTRNCPRFFKLGRGNLVALKTSFGAQTFFDWIPCRWLFWLPERRAIRTSNPPSAHLKEVSRVYFDGDKSLPVAKICDKIFLLFKIIKR